MKLVEAGKLVKQAEKKFDIIIPPIEWVAHPFTQAQYDNWAAKKLKTQEWIKKYKSQIQKAKPIIYLIIDTAGIWNFSDMQYCVNPAYCSDTTGTGIKDDHGHSHMIGTTTFHKQFGIIAELAEEKYIEVGLIKSLSKGGGLWPWITNGMLNAEQIAKQNPDKQVVVNCSFGAPNASNATMSAIAERASKEHGVIWIGSIGNSGQSRELGSFPGIDKSFIGVGAVDMDKKAKSYSSKSQFVDTTSYSGVPGYDHLGNFGSREGTSFSAPNFAALLCLALLSGVTTRETYINDIKTKGIDLGEKGFDNVYGYGLLDFDTWTKESKPDPEPPKDDPKPEPPKPPGKNIKLTNTQFTTSKLRMKWKRKSGDLQYFDLRSITFDLELEEKENFENALSFVSSTFNSYFTPSRWMQIPDTWDVRHVTYWVGRFLEYHFKNNKLGKLKVTEVKGGQHGSVFTQYPDKPFTLNDAHKTVQLFYKK